KNKIDPKIGPIQGVQPAAKPKPTKNVPKYPAGFFVYLKRFSFIRYLIFIHPPTNSPIKIMKIPAKRWMSKPVSPTNSDCIQCHQKEATTTKLINTRETPNRKNKEWINNVLRIFIS